MGLEEIEGIKEIRADLKELTEAREITIPDARKSISSIRTKYNALIKENGADYCDKYCPEVPIIINKLCKELRI